MNKTDVLIIGAGPTGLFCAHQLGIIGLSCEIVDNLDKAGGQCIELYPDKPIYDIPAVPECTGEELTNNLLQQIKPFNVKFHLNERVENLKKFENRWNVKTSGGLEFDVAAIVIAGGVGSFEPRKPPIENVSKYENKGVQYSIPDKNFYKDKKIIIFGGGDSALDWTVELSKIASHVTLVHRRDEFKAANHTVNLMKQLVKEGQVDLITKNQISDVKGSDRVEKAIIKDNDGNEKIIDCDEILIFYGLKMELGPINDWGLNLNEKQIEVNTENFETNLSGVFAMGDISYYPGKLKLILSGFHEAALAAQKAFIRARPDETLTFRYTTSSSDIQKKLGVK